MAGAGNWGPVFIIGVVLDLATALFAIGVLKPWRRRMLTAYNSQVELLPAQ